MSNILSLVSGPLRYALIASLIPFFGSFYISQNGVYRDYVAISGGSLAILLGFVAFTSLGKAANKGTYLGLTIAALALGAFQLIRGFGLIG